MEKQPYNVEPDEETETSVPEQDEVVDFRPEMSPVQEKFLELIDAEKMLPKGWGASERPMISYFGILSAEGVLAFNPDGQRMIHEVMAEDSKENISAASDVWERIFGDKMLEAEIAANQKSVEARRKGELAKVSIEKENVLRQKRSQNMELQTIVSREKAIADQLRIMREEKYHDGLAETERQLAEITDEAKRLRKQHAEALDVAFREFALRRGWYKDNGVFHYLDKTRGRQGLDYEPDFARKLTPTDYEDWRKKMFRSAERKLSPNEKRTDGGSTVSRVSERDSKGKPIDWKEEERGQTLEEMTSEITDKIGLDAAPEIMRMIADMERFIKTEDTYRRRKQAWRSGGFAEPLGGKRRIYPCFSEIERIHKYFDKVLMEKNASSADEMPAKIAGFKELLGKRLFNGETADEVCMLPTGIVAYKGSEKTTHTMLVYDESATEIIEPELVRLWAESWWEYTEIRLPDDIGKLARGMNRRTNPDNTPSPSKTLFNRFSVRYNDGLINERTGYFPPAIDENERVSLELFLKEYGGFVGAVEYNDAETRFVRSIQGWREELMKNIRGVNPVAPHFVREAFAAGKNGLIITMDKVPSDVGNDVGVFAGAAQMAIWDAMSGSLKDEFYEVCGERLNVRQTVFVRLFGEFVYNAARRKDVLARVIFFDQFSKWQKGALDGADADYFDRLAGDFKRP